MYSFAVIFAVIKEISYSNNEHLFKGMIRMRIRSFHVGNCDVWSWKKHSTLNTLNIQICRNRIDFLK